MKKSVKHKFQYLLFFLLSMPAFIFASAQDIRVNIDFTKASLGSVLNEIGRQTSLSIVYNTGDVNPTQPVSIKASNENITTVMNRLLRGTGLSYSIMNKHLILSTTDKNHSIPTGESYGYRKYFGCQRRTTDRSEYSGERNIERDHYRYERALLLAGCERRCY